MIKPSKIAAVALCAALAAPALGCTAAEIASHNAGQAADNFEVVRELTVFDNVTGDILFIAQGRMSIDVDPEKSRLEVMVAQPGDVYEKHFVGLNETTTYIVKDLSGVDVDAFRYRITINPDLLIPFEPTLATGRGDEAVDVDG